MKSGTIESIFRQIKNRVVTSFLQHGGAGCKGKRIVGHSERDVGGYFEPVLGNKYSYSIRDNYILISGKKHVLPDEVKENRYKRSCEG